MTRYEPFSRDKCPHCSTVVRFEQENPTQFSEPRGPRYSFKGTSYKHGDGNRVAIVYATCPNCLYAIINLDIVEPTIAGNGFKIAKELVVFPYTSGRPPVPQEVPESITNDYKEAALTLAVSPKASAALSRRCLQALLRGAAKTKSKDLNDQIDEVLPHLPPYIAQNLDAVRHIGNFAAHEQKSQITGLILDVEPGEAEWNLEILESLFDFYYVKPEIEKRRREEINKKLEEAGKPKLKEVKGLSN